jgi:hypothetical protein
MLEQTVQSQQVRRGTKTRDFAQAGWSDTRVVSERLARFWVGQVQLDSRDARTQHSVIKSVRCMRERSRVQENAAKALCLRLTDPLDQLALVIGLAASDLCPSCRCSLCNERMDILQGLGSVNLGLTLAKPMQVWPAQNEHPGFRVPFARTLRRSTRCGPGPRASGQAPIPARS